ncbi:MAG TPA: DNA-binding protein [Nitrososphaerales archaeon]|nr:DNA-binding protein [Nitrososphaerales archaeon]
MVSTSGSPEDTASEVEDADLKMLNARRMVELRKRMNSSLAKKAQAEQKSKEPRKPTDREILVKALTERGDEVLNSAEASYPSEMGVLIPQLARLIRAGKVTTISGGELLQFLRSIGMRVSVNTSISVEEHGRFVSLADKIKQEE